MWIIFSLLCMMALTATDIIGKIAVVQDELALIKLRLSVMTAAFVISLLMYFFKMGESGSAPWAIIMTHPLILLVVCFTVLSECLYLFSLYYIGVSIMEAIGSLEGIVIFVGMIIMNVFAGRFNAVMNMLIPARLVLICVIFVFTLLLPNIESIANRKTVRPAEKKNEKKKIVVGLLIALSAVLFGSLDSLGGDAILDAGTVGVVDFIMTLCFSFIVLLPVLGIIYFQKRKGDRSPGKSIIHYTFSYTFFYILQFFCGIYALSIDAVRSEIMFLLYPVMGILAAKLILKEKYSRWQNLCIWVITLAAIAFCVIDTLA